MGFSHKENPEEVLLFEDLVRSLGNIKQFTHIDLSKKLRSLKAKGAPIQSYIHEKSFIKKLSKSKFANKITGLSELGIWESNIDNDDILQHINFYKKGWRGLILDLPSIPKREAKLILVNVCLEEIWKIALKEWEDVMEAKANKTEKEDERVPLFLFYLLLLP